MSRRALTVTMVLLSLMVAGIVGIVSLTGNQPRAADSSGHICQITAVEEAARKCKPGDVVLFTPKLFGNEQLPVIAAAVVCDFTKPIVWTTGGVSCVYTNASVVRHKWLYTPFVLSLSKHERKLLKS